MKKLIHILLIFIILGAVTISGCKKDEPVNLPGSGEIVTTGTIEVPDNINKSGWSLISGLNGGTIRDNQYDLRLNKDAVQLVCVLDANGQPALMAIDVTSSQSSDHIISASTTAEALVFLNPFFCTSDVNEALELKQKIYTLSSFSLLVETINSQLQNGSFTLSGDNNELLNSLDLVYKDLLGSLGLSSLNKVGVVKSSEDFTPSPDFEINALKIVEFEQNSTALSFKVANRAKRWISVFVDKSVNGSTFEQSADPVDIIPSPSISIWNLITKGIQVPVENSQLIQSNTAGYKAIAVKCYGLGTYNIGS